MSKKYLALLPLLVLALAIPAQGQTVVSYVGGQLLLTGKDTESMGAGTVVGAGVYLAEEDSNSHWEMIVWGVQREDEKTYEGDNFNYWRTGTTILLPVIVKKVNMGPYLTVGLGTGWEEGQSDFFATMAEGGIYFKLDKEKKINAYAGLGYSYMESFGAYAIHFGLSFNRF